MSDHNLRLCHFIEQPSQQVYLTFWDIICVERWRLRGAFGADCPYTYADNRDQKPHDEQGDGGYGESENHRCKGDAQGHLLGHAVYPMGEDGDGCQAHHITRGDHKVGDTPIARRRKEFEGFGAIGAERHEVVKHEHQPLGDDGVKESDALVAEEVETTVLGEVIPHRVGHIVQGEQCVYKPAQRRAETHRREYGVYDAVGGISCVGVADSHVP